MNCPPWECPDICKSKRFVCEDSFAKSGSWANRMDGIFSGNFESTLSKLSAQTVQLSTPARFSESSPYLRVTTSLLKSTTSEALNMFLIFSELIQWS